MSSLAVTDLEGQQKSLPISALQTIAAVRQSPHEKGRIGFFQGLGKGGGKKWGPGDIALQVGSQHPSPNVKALCNFEPQFLPEIITSRDAQSACF